MQNITFYDILVTIVINLFSAYLYDYINKH